MKFLIRISNSAPDAFRASCPALPGCAVVGRSRVEARARIEQAVRGYLASLDVALLRDLTGLLEIESPEQSEAWCSHRN